MADRKNTNKYYPIDYDGKVGLNKYVGSHHLRERASKLASQGILVVRFEIPWRIYCEKCDNQIDKGRRYNADKKKVGMYYSTPLLDFKMNCHHCSNHIHIATDPEHRDYRIVSGARRATDTWDSSAQGTMTLMDEEDREEIREDPFKMLEHKKKDKEVGKVKNDELETLIQVQELTTKSDYAINSILRSRNREKRHASKSRAKDAKSRGIGVELLPESESDKKAADEVVFVSKAVSHSQFRKDERQRIRSSSIFGNAYGGGNKVQSKAVEKARRRGLLSKKGVARTRPSPLSMKAIRR